MYLGDPPGHHEEGSRRWDETQKLQERLRVLGYLGVGLVAAATLLYEVALTRIFSIAYGYHFAFLAISLGLLGFGASGTLLGLRRPSGRPLRSTPLARLAEAASLALVCGYAIS